MMPSDMDIFFRVFFFMLGAMLGSFLNVCIVRMPRNESIVFPSSHCPQCKAPIHWFDNIPLISFCILGRRCRSCRQQIPLRYFAVELITACFFVWSYMVFGLSWALVPALTLVGALIVASGVDLEWRIIPDEISVGGMFAGFVLSAVFPALHKGPLPNILSAGSKTAVIMAVACMALHVFKLLKLRIAFEKEDLQIFVLGGALLALQGMAIYLTGIFPYFTASLSALADALQGAVIGGCSLWLTGLIGEVIISKRVVTGFDFKGVVEAPDGLLKALQASGYVDGQGILQKGFRDVPAAGDLKLPAGVEAQRKDIFEILKAVDTGGVMGWGDVKLLAMAGAFLGWQAALVAFFVAPFFGILPGVVKIMRRQDTAIAYGPFLAVGIIVALYWGDGVIAWLLALYGMN